MGLSHSPNIIKDGLFAIYDGANIRSFRGEPTTNYLTTALTPNSATKESFSGTITENAELAPDGTMTAHLFQVSSGYVYQTLTIPAATTITYSVWIRTLDGSSTTSYGPYIWNYNSPTYGIVARDLSGVGPTWKRMQMTYTTLSHQSSFAISYAGTNGGMQGTYAFWRPQLEYTSSPTAFTSSTRGTTNATGGGWVDLSGNGKHGELVNGPTYNSDKGGSIVFDGTNDYINLGNLGTIGNQQTIDVWFYSTSVTNYKNVLDMNYGNYGSTGNVGPRLEQSTGGGSGWVWSGNTSNNSLLTGQGTLYNLSANTWYNATWVNNNGTVSVYLNGVATQTGISSTYGFITTYGAASIGRGFHLDSSRYFAGRVGTVKIYSKVLSATEILQNFNATRDRYGV